MRKTARVLVLAGMVGAAATAGAQEVQFTGSNLGCFYTSVVCTPSGSATDPVADGHALTYVGSTFDAFTSDGYLGIGNAPGTPNVNNLGSVLLANATYNYTTNPTFFVLQTTFTAPTSANALFTAILKGSVHDNGSGGITIDFDNTPQTFVYGGGSFEYSVNDVAVTNGRTIEVTGQLTSTVPEPSSMALLGTGLACLVPVMRRRKQ